MKMKTKILGILLLSYHLITPTIGCSDARDLEAEAESMFNKIQAKVKINPEEIENRLKFLEGSNLCEETKRHQTFTSGEDLYNDFQGLYDHAIQKYSGSFPPFAQTCKNIYDNSMGVDSNKTKIKAHLLFKEVYRKLEDWDRIQKKNEIQELEFEKKRNSIDIDQEVDYFLRVHADLADNSQSFGFSNSWGSNFLMNNIVTK